MSNIQRYSIDGHQPENDGYWVTYADHVEAIAAARAETRYANALVNEQSRRDGYEQGQRDALAAAVQRVEALFHKLNYSGVVGDAVIAAIKGGSDE
jgi:creatinine amidohydrolase/Fe(II)-dependent formamide hydrolase-like protein